MVSPNDRARAPEHSPYPDAALTWLAGDGGRVVLCLGDSVLARRLEERGHDVRTGRAKEHADASVDVVVAVHRAPRDLDDVARVLRPGGRLGIVLPRRDDRIPWVRKLDRTLGTPPPPPIDPADTASNVTELAAVITHGRFGFVDETTLRFWQLVDRSSLLGICGALPEVAALADEERDEVLGRVAELYDGYGRGADGMQLPWTTHCYRTTLAPPAADDRPAPTGEGDAPSEGSGPRDDGTNHGLSDGTDTDMLLIDFR